MDEMIFDTAGVDHPFFYIPAAACCLLLCSVWLTALWRDGCRKSEPTLPRFAPLTPSSSILETEPKPSLLIDKNLTFVMDFHPPPPQTPPPARYRGAAAPLSGL